MHVKKASTQHSTALFRPGVNSSSLPFPTTSIAVVGAQKQGRGREETRKPFTWEVLKASVAPSKNNRGQPGEGGGKEFRDLFRLALHPGAPDEIRRDSSKMQERTFDRFSGK